MKKIETLEQMKELESTGKLIGLFQISNELYHKPIGVSKSTLIPLLRSVAHYEQYLKEERPQTASKQLGSLFHLLVLEPHLFESTYVVSESFDRRTKEGKAASAAFEALHAGKEIISQETLDTAQAMVKAIMAKENARKLLQGVREVAAFWVDPDTGILCKCKGDIVHRTAGLIIDLKSTRDASPEEFMKDVSNYRYGFQESYYIDGFVEAIKQSGETPDFVIPSRFCFIACENTAPHGVALYDIPQDYIENERANYKKALSVLKNYRETKKITSYPDQIQTLRPKAYMYQ